ncbi:MAG: flagellar export chaperone FliS [Pseudomonadota bacterium]
MQARNDSAMNSYRAHGMPLAADSADPHTLIDMLFERALSRLAIARGLMQRGKHHEKGEHVSGVTAIITALQAFLDHDKGGALARNLDALYDYMMRRLIHANVKNDLAALEEVVSLLKEIRSGWQGIKPAAEGAAAEATLSA